MKFVDPAAEAATKRCADENAQCARMVADLDADSTVWKLRTGPVRKPFPGAINWDRDLERFTENGIRIRGGTITLDVANIPDAEAILGVPVTPTTVLVHEFGHAIGGIVMFRVYGNRHAEACPEACANVFENIARGQLSLPLRQF